MMHPRAWNLHDWAEVYFEGVGWVPVDQSFGIPAFARNADEEYFFLGGIDSWRMIVNTDYGMPLVPEKKYPRSETVDFQRGEVEWEGGNLYFPQWSYHMDIDYLNGGGMAYNLKTDDVLRRNASSVEPQRIIRYRQTDGAFLFCLSVSLLTDSNRA